MTPRRPIWSGAEQLQLSESLRKANGARLSRTLTLDDVRATVERALSNPAGFAWMHGGDVDDARALTTVCLAGVRTNSVTVGVSLVHAKGVIPSWGWPDLTEWERSSEPANSARVSAWAARRLDDRVSLVLEPAAPPASSREALLAAVQTSPESDDARLVYADALTESGDPRGEFIALQCARARLAPDDPERRTLEHRETELLHAHRGLWLDGVPASVTCHFARGFVETLEVPDTQTLGALEALVQREPVTRVVLGNDGLRAATPLRWVERLAALELRSGHGTMALDVLHFFDSRVFARLAELSFTSMRLTPKSAVALAASLERAAPKLRRLGLRGSAPSGSLERFMPYAWFNGLLALDLSDNDLRLAGLRPFTSSVVRCKLESLNLDGNHLGDEGAVAVAHSARLGRLRELRLARNRIGLRGAEDLLTSPHLKNLTRLDLDQNPIGTRAKERLAARNRTP